MAKGSQKQGPLGNSGNHGELGTETGQGRQIQAGTGGFGQTGAKFHSR